MPVNHLYLSVLPIVHLDTGLTEQTLTLFPDKDFATEFSSEEVDSYISFFRTRADKYLVGGRIQRYEFVKEVGTNGFITVRVTQHVG